MKRVRVKPRCAWKGKKYRIIVKDAPTITEAGKRRRTLFFVVEEKKTDELGAVKWERIVCSQLSNAANIPGDMLAEICKIDLHAIYSD